MFGLKLVKSKEYEDLQVRLRVTTELATSQAEKIAKQASEIDEYKKKIKNLEATVGEQTKSKKVILLTDVAETPLVEEPKSEGKPKRVVKKTKSSITHKKVTRKTDEQ